MERQRNVRISKYIAKQSRRERKYNRTTVKSAVRAAVRNSAPTSGAKNVRGVIVGGPQGPERKKYETSNTSGVGVNTAMPYVQSLTNNLAQGTGVSQRIGDRIHIKGVDIQFNVQGGSSGTPQYIDVFLVLDTQPEETTAAAGTIFESTNTNLTYVTLDGLERFQVLKRERICLDTGGGLTHMFTWHQSCELATRFSGSTTAPMSNDLLVVALSPSVNTATNFPTLSYIARLTFTDE